VVGIGAYEEHCFADAIRYSQEALELSPRRLDALITIGQAYEARGDVARAIVAFKICGAVAPYYRPEAAALLARAYALGRRMSEAQAQLAFARAHRDAADPVDLAAAAIAVYPSASRRNQSVEQRTRHVAMYA